MEPRELVRSKSDEVKSNLERALVQPKLVRGLTGCATTDCGMAALAKKALDSDPGWASAQLEDIQVTNLSGMGGTQTFKISLPSATPPCICVHSRQGDHDDVVMNRMFAAEDVFAMHGIGPKRIAFGTDWCAEHWSASEKTDWDSMEAWEKAGELLAHVHQIPTDWFEPFREQLVAKYPKLAMAPAESHIWLFMCRMTGRTKHWGETSTLKCLDDDDDVFQAYTAFAPQHRLAKRVVTAHGDFHPGNIIQNDCGKLLCVDFEFTSCMHAGHDLAFAVCCCGSDVDKKRTFLKAYLKTLGEPQSELEPLLVDAHLAVATLWHSGGKLAYWEIRDKEPASVLLMINLATKFAGEVYASEELQEKLTEEGYGSASRPTMFLGVLEELRTSELYATLQHELDGTVEVPKADVGAGITFVAQLQARPDLVLQVKPGTGRCELALADGSSNQEWVFGANGWIQHAQTGLCLETDVKYVHHRERGQQWKDNATVLRLELPRECDPQRWLLEGGLIRHAVDGRVLDVNGWTAESGQGVNVNLAHSHCFGQKWVISGEFAMLRSGKACATPGCPYLKNDDPHYLKIKPPEDHDRCCTRCREMPGKGLHGGLCQRSLSTVVPLDPAPDLCALSECTPFRICVAKQHNLCLDIRPSEHGPHVYLENVDADKMSQLWCRAGADVLKHVASGQVLHAPTKYATAASLEEPWEDNHSPLVLRDPDGSDAQRWVHGQPGEEEFHGGKVLRHYRDGRGVEIHGWDLKSGANMGLENAVNATCDGCSYVFLP